MRNNRILLPLALSGLALAAACGSGGKQAAVPVYDLAAAVESDQKEDLKFTDISITPLDTAAAALIGDRANIVGVLGDTIIVADESGSGGTDRLLLFSLSDGRMLKEISHKGSGPGEYSWIERVFLDPEKREVVIHTANWAAHRYTLSDTLVATYPCTFPTVKKLAIGSLAKGINLYDEYDGGFMVRQLDGNYNLVDSISVDGYKLGYTSGEFLGFGGESYLTMVDTVYHILPGRLEKEAIISRGGMTITPDVEKSIAEMQDWGAQMDRQNQYIMLGRYMPLGEDYVMLVSYYNHHAYIDIFGRKDGRLLTHIPISYEKDAKEGLPVDYKGEKLYTLPSYYNDGRLYAIVPSEEMPGGEDNDDLNAGIISFTITE